MNKAFTREDDPQREAAPPAPVSSLPPGAKNYVTPDGARHLREELQCLVDVERPLLAAQPEDEIAQRQLQLMDQRIAYLQESLRQAEIVRPPLDPPSQVRFGTTVTVHNSRGAELRYRIVGVDETDVKRGWVSWRSPVAAALLKSRVGDQVRCQSPEGEEILSVVAIVYE